MFEIALEEYVVSEHYLTDGQLDALWRVKDTLHLTIELVQGDRGKYKLKPDSTVGTLEIDGVSILIRPKLKMRQLVSLACYAIGMLEFRKEQFSFQDAETLPDILAFALNLSARKAFAQGLLRGYLIEEEALHTVRGRIRFDEQLRRRYCIPLPVELHFDEFTEDVLANRLVKAAAARLGCMSLRSPEARRGLGWISAILENVSLLEFRRGYVPEVRFDRLNEHYRQVVGLARLILLHSEFESFRGDVRASGFLINMNDLFQEFVTQALREALNVSDKTLRDDKGLRRLTLAEKNLAPLRPDLSWWDGETCRFVGDAKYKKVSHSSVPNADLYQLLAYATALDLPGGLLIYAQGEAEAARYRIRNTRKQLEVVALDLSGSLEEILERVKVIARKIEYMTEEARQLPCDV